MHMSRSDLLILLICYMLTYEDRPSQMIFFDVKDLVFMNLILKIGVKMHSKDSYENSCNWLRNRVDHQIDFKAV